MFETKYQANDLHCFGGIFNPLILKLFVSYYRRHFFLNISKRKKSNGFKYEILNIGQISQKLLEKSYSYNVGVVSQRSHSI